MLNFDQKPMYEVISSLESQSDYIVNYDPELLKGLSFSGKLDIESIEEAIKELLYDTPYVYELDGQTILLFLGDKRLYRVCGTIVDAATQEPLIAASVVAEGTNIGTQSDSQGFFDFEITAYKNQKIELSYLGYQVESFLVQELDRQLCPQYKMKFDQNMLGGEILITGYLLDGISQGDSYNSFTLDYDQLSRWHSNIEHDVLKTAQLLPGITSIDDSASNLQIRGSSPGQNLILWDGAPIYNAGHIFGMISAINPFSINGVRIYKGAHDPTYDNRVGGIVDISLIDSIDNSFHGCIGSSLTEAYVNMEVPVIDNQLAFMFSGRKSIRGFYDSPPLMSYLDKVFQFSIIDDLSEFEEEGLIEIEQTLDYHDWSAKVLYHPSQRLNFNLGIYSNQQDFTYSNSLIDDPFISQHRIYVNSKVLNAKVDFEVNKKWSTSFTFYNSLYDNDYNKVESEGNILLREFDQINDIADKSFRFENVIQPSPAISLKAGYEYNRKRIQLDLGEELNFDSEFTGKSDEQVDFQNLFVAIGVKKNKFKLDGGMRSTYYSEFGDWFLSPRINLQYILNSKLKLNVDGGLYHQFVSQLTNFGTQQISVDNPLWILNSTETQLSQRAQKIAAGFVFHQGDWLVDVDAYYNFTEGISTISPILNLLAGDVAFSKGSSSIKGIDLLVKKRWSLLNTWINYSLSSSKYNFSEISETSFYAPNDMRHNISLVTSYNLKDVQLSLTSNYHSGLPFSIPEVLFVDSEEEMDPQFLYFLDYKSLNKDRLSPYLRIDFNISYRRKIKRMKNVNAELSLTLINFLNRKNELERGYYLDFENEVVAPNLNNVSRVLLGRTPLCMLRFYW